jgi:mRNA interferase RelE/StbE
MCIEDGFGLTPKHHPNVKPLSGPFFGQYRFRAGDYRVVYEVDENSKMVHVMLIAHRSEAYR